MAVQINVAANQAALMQSIAAGVQAYNQRFANQNQINLQINARAFSQPLGRITGDVKDFEAALAASNARVIAFGASTAILGGVIRSFKSVAEITIEVEKNLTDINRVFGLTTKELQKFSTDLFNVSKQTASSFKDASQAALEFSRQGVKAEQVLQRTTDALTLARLAGMNVGNAIEALTATVNGFATTGITTTQVLNKLVAVEQNYAVSAGDLAEALARTGLAAQEAGVSIDELNALVTAAQEKTARGGAVIGNALKTIFTRLQRPETLDQLEQFNIAVRDVQGNILPATQILKNFAGAYQSLADSQRAQLSEQVAGVYQVNILKAIVSDLNSTQGAYNGALTKGANATNEAQLATAKLNQSLDALLSQTSTVAQQFANNIGKVTFEPLAKYTAETFKSLFENLNEILEGEGLGSTFANGLLKGIRNILAGPGAIGAFFVLAKLLQNSFSYLTQALPQIVGITTESQNRKNIEQAILQIMQQQSPISQALAGQMGNQAAQAQLLLQLARQQTAEYQRQQALVASLAPQLARQGVTVKGGSGLSVTRSKGFLPNFEENSAKSQGATSSVRAVKGIGKIGGKSFIANNQEMQIPNFAGTGETAVIPTYGGGMQKAISMIASGKSGSILSNGFIPNFVKKTIKSLKEPSLNKFYDVGNDFYDYYDDTNLVKTINLPLTYEQYRSKARYTFSNAQQIYFNEGLKAANDFLKRETGGYSQSLEKKYFEKPDPSKAEKHLNKIAGAFGEQDTAEIFQTHQKLANYVGPDFYKFLKNKALFVETKVRKDDVSEKTILEKLFRGLAITAKLRGFNFKNKKEEDITADSASIVHAIAAKSSGFIPNFGYAGADVIRQAVESGNIEKFRMPGTKTFKFPSGTASEAQVNAIAQRATKGTVGQAGALTYKGSYNFERKELQTPNGEQMIDKEYENFVKSTIPSLVSAHDNNINFSLPFSGGPNSFIDFFDPNSKTFYEAKGGTFSDSEVSGKFKNARIDLNNQLNKQLQSWKNTLVYDPNYANKGFIPNFASIVNTLGGTAKIEGLTSKGAGTLGSQYNSIFAKLQKNKNIKSVTGTLLRQIGNAPKENTAVSQIKAIIPQIIRGRQGEWSRLFIGNNTFDFNSKTFDAELEKNAPQILSTLNSSNAEVGLETYLTKKSKQKSTTSSSAYDDLKRSLGLDGGFIPNFNSIKGRNIFQAKWLKEKAKALGLDINNPDVMQTLGTLFAKSYPNQQMMFGLHDGFIPNFASEPVEANKMTKIAEKSGSNLFINSDGTLKVGFLRSLQGNPLFSILKAIKKGLIKKIDAGSIIGPRVPNLITGLKNVLPDLRKNNPLIPSSIPIEGSFSPKDLIRNLYRNKAGFEYYFDKDLITQVNEYLLSKGFEIKKGSDDPYNDYSVINKKDNKPSDFYDPSDRVYLPPSFSSKMGNYMLERFTSIPGIKSNITKKRKTGSYNYNREDLSKLRKAFEEMGVLGASKQGKTVWENLSPEEFGGYITLKQIYPNGISKGFLPNFAYKNAVMNLEENLSGNNAVLDTRTGPFPFIRNSSQPNFAAAINDHGGLGAALKDSYRNQVAAGLMNNGFVPNFAKKKNRLITPTASAGGAGGFDPAAFEAQMNALANQTLTQVKQAFLSLKMYPTYYLIDPIEQGFKVLQSQVKSTFAKTNSTMSGFTTNLNTSVQSFFQRIMRSLPSQDRIDKFMNTALFAAPLIGGQLESALFANKQRTEMTGAERFGQSALSTGLTSVSTAASIGNMILPGWGAAIGAGVGALFGLTQALGATKLSADELAQKYSEQQQKAQESISAAGNYIDAQKQLTDMVAKGASSTEIENATKKLSDNFMQIKDAKLQEEFLKAGGDLQIMTKQLQEYTNEQTKKSAFRKGLIEKGTVEERASAFNIALNKEEKTGLAKNLRDLIKKRELSQQEALRRFSANTSAVGGGLTAIQDDKAIGTVKKIAKDLLSSRGITESSTEYASEFNSAVKNLMDMPVKDLEELAASLEKSNLTQDIAKSILKLNKTATESFANIFKQIEESFQIAAYQTAMQFERESSAQRINASILEFTSSFNEGLSSFLMSNLPDYARSGLIQENARQKAEFAQQKLTQDYAAFETKQSKDRADALTKNAEDLTKSFKESMLNSQENAQYFRDQILGKLQTGNYNVNVGQIANEMKNARIEQFKNIAVPEGLGLNMQDLNLNDEAAVQKFRTQVSDLMGKKSAVETDPNKKEEIIKTFNDILTSLNAALNASEFAKNTNAQEDVKRALEQKQRTLTQFQLEQENAKKELIIQQTLNQAKIIAEQKYATEKAKIDEQNMMRLQAMKTILENLSNQQKLVQAQGDASIAAIQRQLNDPRQELFMGGAERVARRNELENQMMERRFEMENKSLDAEIQQAAIQIAVEQENTNALYKLNESINKFVATLLQDKIGGASVISEMENNPYVGMDGNAINNYLEQRQASLGSNYNANYEESLIQQSRFYTPEQLANYQAYKYAKQQSMPVDYAKLTNKYEEAFANLNKEDFSKEGITVAEQQKILEKKINAEQDVVMKQVYERLLNRSKVEKEILKTKQSQVRADQEQNQEIAKSKYDIGQRLKTGFGTMSVAADDMIMELTETAPARFADNMTSALMDVAKGTKSIGDAFTDMAINFSQMLMEGVMRAAIYKTIGSLGSELFQSGGIVGKQRGGIIYAEDGAYIPGNRTGDRNLAMLEDGEYVLNREAVSQIGVSNLDSMNYGMFPRFQDGGGFGISAEMGVVNGENDYTGQLMQSDRANRSINYDDYTAYAYSEEPYFKKIREQSIKAEQQRIQDLYQSKVKNLQLMTSIMGAVGAMVLGAGMSNLGSSAAVGGAGKQMLNTQGGQAAVQGATSTIQTGANQGLKATTDEMQQELAKNAAEMSNRQFANYMANNADKLTINGETLQSLNATRQIAEAPLSAFTSKNFDPTKFTGQFSGFSKYTDLMKVFARSGYGGLLQSNNRGVFSNMLQSGLGSTQGILSRRQTGGLVGYQTGGYIPYGSRISDNIPRYMSGGMNIMSNNANQKYIMSSIPKFDNGSANNSVSNTTNNNTNSTNIAINIDKSGKTVIGESGNNYSNNEYQFSQQLAKVVAKIADSRISDAKRSGGQLSKKT